VSNWYKALIASICAARVDVRGCTNSASAWMRRSCHLFRTSCASPFGPSIRSFKVLLHFSAFSFYQVRREGLCGNPVKPPRLMSSCNNYCIEKNLRLFAFIGGLGLLCFKQQIPYTMTKPLTAGFKFCNRTLGGFVYISVISGQVFKQLAAV